MNLIRKLVKTPYMFHMEDDWRFFERHNYISECLEVLGQNTKIGQCLVNKNYAETGDDHDIRGGHFHTTSTGLRYYLHEHFSNKEEKEEFLRKYGRCKQCAYWPHFSFRPSLLRTHILSELGEFNETTSHFEMEYASRYINAGYISAFLEGIYCTHTGRLTSERNDETKENAYTLNNEAQFTGKEEQVNEQIKEQVNEQEPKDSLCVKTFVVNLDRRPDRWEKFTQQEEPKFLQYQRFPAVDGSKLVPTPQLQQIFDHNDYNMRQGMVGCAMSHIKLYVQLLKDSEADMYCILEDDITFVPDFQQKFFSCVNDLRNTGWDMFYMGHHLWKQFMNDEVYSKTLWPKVEQFDRAESLRRSMGGTGGYLITKRGAEKLLDFINRTGMTNGIDTVQQKSADELNVFYAYPHLIYSECYRGDNDPDTDIQHNYTSLTLSWEERLQQELQHYPHIIHLDALNSISEVITMPMCYQSDDRSKIARLARESPHPCYTLDDRVLFLVPYDNGRYFHRFKKNGEWNIDEALQEM